MGKWLIHNELERAARWHHDKTAFVFEDTAYTYAEFDNRVNQVSHALFDLGVRNGDGILVHALNHVDLFTLFFACSKLGAVYSTISRFHSTENAVYICEEVSDPVCVFYSNDEIVLEGHLPTMRETINHSNFVSLDDPVQSDDYQLDTLIADYPTTKPEWSDDHSPNSIQHTNLTSGTTGRPKAALRDHVSTLHFSGSRQEHAFPYEEADQWLTIQDMMTGRAAYIRDGIPTLASGGTIHLLRSFDAKTFCEKVDKWNINGTALGGTRSKLVIDHLEDTSNEIHIEYIEGGIRSEREARSLYEICDVLYSRFAQTEVGAPLRKRIEPPFDGKPPIGRPDKGVDIRLVPLDEDRVAASTGPPQPGDVGELVCKGEGTMNRYLEDEHQEQYVQDGWIFTGDMVRVNDDTELVFLDRVDNRLRSGGINVFPGVIEGVLEGHSDVEDAVIIGIDDETWGDKIATVIVPTNDAVDTAQLENVLDEYCLSHEALTREVRPRAYVFVSDFEEIPTAAGGKVDRAAVEEKYFTDEN